MFDGLTQDRDLGRFLGFLTLDESKAFAKHLFTHAKSMGTRRNKRGTSHLNQSDSKRVTKEMFPYGAN